MLSRGLDRLVRALMHPEMLKCIHRFAPAILFAVPLALAGCNFSDKPSTYPVRGNVVYKGVPVAGASIAFMGSGAPRAATGKTDESGSFQLTTFQPNDGAVPGMHEVTIKKYTTDPPPMPTPEEAEKDPSSGDRYTAAMVKWTESAKLAVPKKYTDRATTDLHYEVKEGENDFQIELVD